MEKVIEIQKHIKVLNAMSSIEKDIFNAYRNNTSGMIDEARNRAQDILVPLIGEPVNGRLTYEQLDRLQVWLLGKFNYVSDTFQFNEEDYWDPSVWIRAVLSDTFSDDCDGFGYAVLGILYYVFNYNKRDLRRVACAAETGEGHFITFIRSDEQWLVLENRIQHPVTIENRIELGYDFWYMSTMEAKYIANNKWIKTTNKNIGPLLFTNIRAKADNKDIQTVNPIDAIDYIGKSKTLQASAGTIVVGTIGVASGLANQHDWRTVGMFALIVAMGIGFWWLRTVTYKSLKDK